MDDDKLIILVEENDILYNKFNKFYRLPEKKRAVWSLISKEMCLPEENCVKRWSSLRDRFAKEKKNEMLASGSGASFKHRWHLMSQLEFLTPHITPRPVRSTANIVEENEFKSNDNTFHVLQPLTPESQIQKTSCLDIEIQELETQDPFLLTTSTPVSKMKPVSEAPKVRKNKKQVDDTDKLFVEALETFKEFCKSKEEKTQKKESDPIYAFGKMVVATINTLTAQPKLARQAQRFLDISFDVEVFYLNKSVNVVALVVMLTYFDFKILQHRN